MPAPTAITRTAIIAQNFVDGGPQQAGTYNVTKRVTLDGNVDVEDAAHMAIVLGAFGKPLSALRATMVLTERMGMMRLRAVNAVPVSGSSNTTFDVTARYDQLYTWAEGPAGQGLSTLLLPVEVDFDATPRSVLMYRSPTFSTQPAADLNTTTNIGGTKVDYAGKPIQALIPQMTVRVSLVFDASGVNSGMTLVSVYDKISSLSGKWNNATFLHWTANQVYCESGSVSHIRDEYYRATFNLRWDLWYGCEQQPKTDVWGKPYIDGNGAADTVTWKSLVRTSANLSTMFNLSNNPTAAAQIAKEGSFLTYP
jgi:hypothetical protein